MGYLGSVPVLQSTSFTGVNSQALSPNGSTAAFTMNRTVANTKDIEVIVDNVQQSPYDGSYSVSGTTITFSENPPAGTNSIYIIYRDAPIGSITDPLAVKKAGDTMIGDLVIQGDTKRVRVTDNTRYLTLGQWDGVTNRIESSGAEMLMVQYGASNKLRLQHASIGDALTIDSSGRVFKPFQPAFHALRNSGAVAANTVVLWNAVPLNRGSCYNSSTGRFTAPATGDYLLHTRMNNDNGLGIHPEIRINGANTDYYRGFGYDSGGGNNHASVTAIVTLNAGDYVDVVTGTYGSMQGTPGNNNGFCGYLLG